MARKKDVIDPLLEEVLYELIAEKINAIPPAEAEETVKKLQAFLQCNAYRNQQKRITIASLVDLLQIMEIRIIDLYEAAGIKVSWPKHLHFDELVFCTIYTLFSASMPWRRSTTGLAGP